MLSVPTLWIVFVVNFLAMGLLWTYVTRSYPNFEAARYWTAAAFAAAFAAALGMSRQMVDSLAPLVFAGTLIILACCLCLMGIRSFYGRRPGWRATLSITGSSFLGLSAFLLIYDSSVMRVVIYTIGQSIPAAMTLPLVLSQQDNRPQPGARLAAVMAVSIIVLNVVRGGGGSFACRRHDAVRSLQQFSGPAHAPAGVPVDGVEFRFPADGHRPVAQ